MLLLMELLLELLLQLQQLLHLQQHQQVGEKKNNHLYHEVPLFPGQDNNSEVYNPEAHGFKSEDRQISLSESSPFVPWIAIFGIDQTSLICTLAP